MTINWGYIFHAPETDPAVDRLVIERGGVKSTIVAVPDKETAAKVAVELAESGLKSIELCGYFGISGAALVTAAVNGRAAVNSVMFPAESVPLIMKAFNIPAA